MFDVANVDEGKMLDMGALGEQLVAKVLTEKFNAKVVLSGNPWDSVKDMTVNGVNCEVKTQIPWCTQNAFAVKKNQQKKCNDAEVLIFVEPPYNNPYGKNDAINIWLSKKEERKFFHKRSNDGRIMIGYPLRNMEIIHTIDDSYLCEKIVKLSNSQV